MINNVTFCVLHKASGKLTSRKNTTKDHRFMSYRQQTRKLKTSIVFWFLRISCKHLTSCFAFAF
ncbi:hypothetical protein HanRHA438_Chr13g0615951 [Helianthus annuus]|nr:hypothetical protein HanIR_Chr13g0657631 [Helianthus annuus]KAJ0859731.1 hypothetical protein HanRHA438_Chr13g0615951 [Helianthus annuus]